MVCARLAAPSISGIEAAPGTVRLTEVCGSQVPGHLRWRSFAPDQVRFHAQFDHIVLLSAPLETLVERLATRTDNPFGKAPEELRRILDDVETIEPLLRRVAAHEVRTTMPLNEVVTTVLRLVVA